MEKLIKNSKRCSIYIISDDSGKKRIKRVMNGGDAEVYRLLMDNPNKLMPKILSVSEDENGITVIEEFVEGEIVSEACFSEKQMLKAAKELCLILAHIHRLGIVHRDVKPSNILMTPNGHICLIDFDAARRMKPQSDSDTRYLGTAGFAPPEQYGFSQTDARSDIYALGKTFECIFGSLAFDGKYKKIISKCTRLDPDERYSNAEEVLKALSGRKSVGAAAVGAIFILSAAIGIIYANRGAEAVPAIAETSASFTETASVTETSETEILTESSSEAKVTETTSAKISETAITTTVQTSDTVSETVAAVPSEASSVSTSATTSETTVTENADPFAKYGSYYKNLDITKAQRIPEEKMEEPLLFKADDDIPMEYIIIDAESLKENKYVSMLCDYNGDGYDDLFQLSAYNPEDQNEYFRSLCVSMVKLYDGYPEFHVISDNSNFRYLISTASMDQETGMIGDGRYVQLSVLDVNSDGYKDIVLSVGSVGNTINTQVFYYNNFDLAYSSSGKLNLYLYTSKQITCKGYDRYYVPDGTVHSLTLEDTLAAFKYVSPNVWSYEMEDDPLYKQFRDIAS